MTRLWPSQLSSWHFTVDLHELRATAGKSFMALKTTMNHAAETPKPEALNPRALSGLVEDSPRKACPAFVEDLFIDLGRATED